MEMKKSRRILCMSFYTVNFCLFGKLLEIRNSKQTEFKWDKLRVTASRDKAKIEIECRSLTTVQFVKKFLFEK